MGYFTTRLRAEEKIVSRMKIMTAINVDIMITTIVEFMSSPRVGQATFFISFQISFR
jgi:hypothetical protein